MTMTTIYQTRIRWRYWAAVRDALNKAGYKIDKPTVGELSTVQAVAEYCEPFDQDAQRELMRLIAETADIQPRRKPPAK